MYRTNAVKLTVIPAFAYRQRLTSGGAGITILRPDAKQPGIASISKTSGEPIPAKNTPVKLYPPEAFAEAIALTAGMPYKKQNNIKVTEAMVAEPVPEETAEEADAVIDSSDYQKIAEHYTDKNGKLSYDLINKDMIRFAHSSSIVREMIAKKEGPAKIRDYITGMKFRNITENRDLTDAQVKKISGLLDEVSPKGVYKELNAELKKASEKIGVSVPRKTAEAVFHLMHPCTEQPASSDRIKKELISADKVDRISDVKREGVNYGN